MLVRVSPTEKFEKYWEFLQPKLKMEETVLIYSMWGEYVNPNSQHKKKDYLNFVSTFPHVEKLHTSGHATAETLAKVCQLVNPKRAIIPIHKEQSADFSKLDISDDLKEKINTSSEPINFFNFNMRRLKITPEKPLTKEEEEREAAHREFVSKLTQEEYYWYREEHHEKKTGLKDGAHVRYLGVDEKDWQHCVSGCHGSLHLNEILDLENTYEIDHIVRRIAKLVGFRDVEFSSGIFEAVNKDEEKKTLKPGDYLRYIASDEYLKRTYPHNYSDPRGVLDFEAVYEVESVELCLMPAGYLGVKLVGFEDKLFNRRLFERV